MPRLIFLLKKNNFDFLNWLHAAEKGHSGEQGLRPSTVWTLTDHEQFGIRGFGLDFAQYLIRQSLDLKRLPKHRRWGLPVWVNRACPCTGGNTAALLLCPPPRELEENLGQSTEDCITGISTY